MFVRLSRTFVASCLLTGWALAQTPEVAPAPAPTPAPAVAPTPAPAPEPVAPPALTPIKPPAGVSTPSSGAVPAKAATPAKAPVSSEMEMRTVLKAPKVAESGMFVSEVDAAKLRALLKANPALANQPIIELRGEKPSTPLLEAVKTGNLDAVRALLEAGAKPNLLLEGQTTSPLLATLASRFSGVVRLQEVRLLLASGASTRGALHVWAASTNWTDRRTYFGAADALVGAKATLSATNETGATPLQVAVINDNVLAVEKLVSLGATADDLVTDLAYAGSGTAEGKLILKFLKLPETRPLKM